MLYMSLGMGEKALADYVTQPYGHGIADKTAD